MRSCSLISRVCNAVSKIFCKKLICDCLTQIEMFPREREVNGKNTKPKVENAFLEKVGRKR